MKKIFIFSSVHNWRDTRIFCKQAVSLAKKFYVELHAPADFTFKKVGGVNVVGLPKWKKRKDRSKIALELWKRIRKSDCDIFHFHDPELIFHGIFVRLIRNKKTIFDVHENIPRQILSKDYIKSHLLRKIISILFFILEFIACRFFNKVIVAGEDILKNEKKRIIINNYPIVRKNEKITKKNLERLAYLGSITKIRGIEEILLAIQKINTSYYKNLKLIAIGPFKNVDYKEYILQKFDKELEYLGIMKQSDAFKIIRKCFVGIALYQPVPNHYCLRSNKVFEYLDLGLPVVYPYYKDWVKKLSDGEVGYAVKPDDIDEIAQKVNYLSENEETVEKLSKNAKKLVSEKYSWKMEEKKLINLYQYL
ncbi:MAG: glycosyltransferase [Candidatus Cloacimonetes bacterium]|nr:glycosyltransferase [Candidatus Cloacimonadota bacterium]